MSELSHDLNFDYYCRKWYGSGFDVDTFTDTLSCPCNKEIATADARWRQDGKEYPDDRMCYYERRPVETSSQVGGNVTYAMRLLVTLLIR